MGGKFPPLRALDKSLFMQRHSSLSLRTSDPLSRVRANAVTKENMKNYFDLLEKTLKENDLFDKPSLIYNMDESGMPLDHKQPKRVAAKGTKKVHGPSSGDKSQITIVAACNAAGNTLPPMVIFKGEKLNHQWTVGEVPGTLYGMSESGWIDQELFSMWLEKIFIPNIPPQRPVLLMLDGHGSHYSPEGIQKAAKEGVIVFCIPPNTTHKAQPLDVSFFGPLKRHWSSVCHSYLVDNPGSVVTKLQFSRLFSQAWYKAIRPETIINGFKKTGVCPFSNDAIEVISNEAESQSESLSEGNLPPEEQLPSEEQSPMEVEFNYNCPDTPSSSNDPSRDASKSPPVSNGSTADTVILSDNSFSDDGFESEPPPPMFTAEQIEKFEKRIENGYDVFSDATFVSWLKFYHPNYLPSDYSDKLSPSVSENPLPSAVTTPVSESTVSTVSQSLASARVALSPVSEFLVLPTPSTSAKKGKSPGSARVLTSEESLAMIIEKEQKKKEEEEAKEKRKQERAEKKLQREADKKKKAEERELKAIERKKKAAEAEAERERKRKERELKALERQKADKEKQKQKEKRKSKQAFTKVFTTRSKSAGYAPQHCESGSDECTVCFGKFTDDIDPSTDGAPERDWIQCTSCDKWMHEDCATRGEEGSFICCVCGATFI